MVNLCAIYLIIILSTLLCSIYAYTEDIVITDFEGSDFGDWTVEGTAFGSKPAFGNVGRQTGVKGFNGKGLANSFHGDDQAKGSLTSKEFEITKDYIHFKIAGGNDLKKTSINLMVEGKIVRQAAGIKQDLLIEKRWDVKALKGKTAIIKIIDDKEEDWAYISVDHIVLSDRPDLSTVLIADFEGKDFGNWTVEGEAFGSAPAKGPVGRQGTIKDFQGQKLANSFHKDDEGMGLLRSPEFTISANYIHFNIGGGNHSGETCISLIINGKVVRTSTGTGSSSIVQKAWDVSTFKGKIAHLEIVDSHIGSWGFILVDHIVMSNKFMANAQKHLPENFKLIRPPKPVKSKVRNAPKAAPQPFIVTAFADKKMVQKPLAMCFDEKNRMYVAETQRFHNGVEDTRRHHYWFLDEIRINKMADRQALYDKWTALGKFKEGHFTKTADIVSRIEDSDNDGVADKRIEYAKFNHALDGNGSSVAYHNGKVYYTNIPNFWVLEDKDDDGIAEKKESLFTGFGLRLGVNGHDMHGIEWGPDGRIYWSLGDRGYVVKTKEGKILKDTDSGAIFRCEFDGSNLEVFASQVRNPQDLAFNQYGDLFSVDNNRGGGDESRLCFYMQGANIGWTSGNENLTTFARPLGVGKRENPRPLVSWYKEKIWQTAEQSKGKQPAYIFPPIDYIPGGSCGITFNPGKAMGEKYNNHFLFSDWSGGLVNFAVKDSGGGIKMIDNEVFMREGQIVDSDFDWNGNLYVMDYRGQKVMKVVHPEAKKHPSIKSAAQIMTKGIKHYNDNELLSFLSHDDMRIRLFAQFELAGRGESSIELFKQASNKKNLLVTRLHGIWGLGHLARKNKSIAAHIAPYLKDSSYRIRGQAAKAIGESSNSSFNKELISLLSDENLRVRSYATIALGNLKVDDAASALATLLKENDDKDPYVRHAGVMGLSGLSKSRLMSLAKDESKAVRMAVLLVLRRHKDNDLGQFLMDQNPLIAQEALSAINTLTMADAYSYINDFSKKYFGSVKASDELTDINYDRLVNINFRAGKKVNAQNLISFAINDQLPERIRLQSLFALERWSNPEDVDYTIGLIKPYPKDRELDIKNILEPHLAGLQEKAEGHIQAKATDLALQYKIKVDINIVINLVLDPSTFREARLNGIGTIVKAKPKALESIILKLNDDADDRIRVVALQELAKIAPQKAVEDIKQTLEKGTKYERQRAYETLASINGQEAENVIIDYLNRLINKTLESEYHLDILEAAAMRPESSIKQLLKKYDAAINKEDKLAIYQPLLSGGDIKEGKRVFESGKSQCIICHSVRRFGGNVGPKLDEIGSRKSKNYLLESIFFPSESVTPGYGNTIITTIDGKTISASLIKEDDQNIYLQDADKKEIIIPLSQVKSRQKPISTMPAMGLIMSKKESRDIIEYLHSLKSKKKPIKTKKTH